jgi:hypothetical protein
MTVGTLEAVPSGGAVEGESRSISTPNTGALHSTRGEEELAERCTHEVPDEKGCYLGDPNHPQRKRERGKW